MEMTEEQVVVEKQVYMSTNGNEAENSGSR